MRTSAMMTAADSPAPARRALLAGAAGRRGEALLNALLAAPAWRSVHVLAGQPMSLAIPRLQLCRFDDLPPVDDLFLVVGDPAEPGSRSFHGRDAPFDSIDEDRALALARRGCDAGASRIVLVAPAPDWQQIGSLQRGLGGVLETQLGALSARTVLILRPLKPGGAGAGSLIQRFVHGYLSLQMLMLPRSVPVLTSEQLARAALGLLAGAGHGLQVLTAADIEASLGRGRSA
ncbi:MAG: hypothetical protein R3E68_13555 [Burkholderiaceae bacterium]